MRLTEKCEKCGKPAEIKSTLKLGQQVIQVLRCGHMQVEVEKALAPDVSAYEVKVGPSAFTVTSSDEKSTQVKQELSFQHGLQFELDRMDSDGRPAYDEIAPEFYSLDHSKAAYPFQRIGVRFAQATDYNCLIADAMGLGKTVQALIAAKMAKKRTLICVKGATLFQWAKEARTWLNSHPIGVMPIVNRNCIIPGFDTYIISIDFLGRKGVVDKLNTLGIEMIIIDECQNFKDQSSERTKALIKLIQANEIKHRLFLSGTPIKNRATEYFTILNLLDPRHFYSKLGFCRTWLTTNEKGIYTKLDPGMIDRFREVTSRYIIRREKQDVLTNLPPLTRDYQYMEIEDELVKNSYNKELDLFQNFLNTGQTVNSTVMLGWLAKMRSITGQGKIPWAIDYTKQFLDETDESLAIGIHHHNVRDVLKLAFSRENYVPLSLSGEDNIYKKDQIQRAFNEGRNRLLIINAIAGGVGLNLQSCSNAVVLERQWSSADEEQFEARFHRDGQKKHVNVVYPIAQGTIDEFFHDLVEKKRKIVQETMGDSYPYDPSADEELLKDLVETTLRHKL